MQGALKTNSWHKVASNILHIIIPFSNFKMTGYEYTSCDFLKLNESLGMKNEESGTIQLRWDLSDLSVRLRFFFGESNLVLASSKSENIDKTVLSIPEFQSRIMSELVDNMSKFLTLWVRERLRNLVFSQSAFQVMEDQSLWQSGVLIEKGAIRLELLDAAPAQKGMTFAFYPRTQGSLLATQDAVQFFFNALLLNGSQVGALLSQKNYSLQSRSPLQLAEDFSSYLQHYYPELPQTQVPPPTLNRSQSDMTLFLHQNLTNATLNLFYREGLLRFRATVDVGNSTMGIIADKAYDISTVISISPRSAPEVTFDQNLFRLNISGYRMNLGTWIEDRIIPSTEIEADVSVAAHLTVNSAKSSVMLEILPDDFLLSLKELKGRMSSEDVDFFKTLANKVWIDYLHKNSELPLLPFLVNSSKTAADENSGKSTNPLSNLRYDVTRAELIGPYIALDLQTNLETVTW